MGAPENIVFLSNRVDMMNRSQWGKLSFFYVAVMVLCLVSVTPVPADETPESAGTESLAASQHPQKLTADSESPKTGRERRRMTVRSPSAVRYELET